MLSFTYEKRDTHTIVLVHIGPLHCLAGSLVVSNEEWADAAPRLQEAGFTLTFCPTTLKDCADNL